MRLKINLYAVSAAFLIALTSMTLTSDSRELLYGNWFGGTGLKYNMSNGNVISKQPLPAGHALFIYTEGNEFINTANNTSSLYEYEDNRIYADIAKPYQLRYYNVHKLDSDSLVVFGPFKKDGSLYDPSALYRLSYYRRRF